MDNRSVKTQITLFFQLLYEEKFFEAHEALELLWFPRRYEKNDEILILKGLINLAVSLELLKRKRPLSSIKVFKTYLKYKNKIEELPTQKRDFYQDVFVNVEKIYAIKTAVLQNYEDKF